MYGDEQDLELIDPRLLCGGEQEVVELLAGGCAGAVEGRFCAW